MFWKRKDEQPARPAGANAQPRFAPPTGIGKFSTVIVPRSAALRAADPKKAYDLVQAVINFVNTMMGEGVYSRDEIPAKAMQAYHADFYLAQVNNGGHSQFIHNCRGNLKYILADIRAGLTGMKADKHLAIFEQMAAWITQHRDEASKQTGFNGGRAPLLDELDKRFYAIEKEAPMISQSAPWIVSWPELRPVADSDYADAMKRTAMMNPLREARLLWRSVGNLHRQMTNWLEVGVGLACTNAPQPEIKLAIRGGSTETIEGESQMAYWVHTNVANARFCVVTQKHAALYEVINDNPPMPQIGDVEGMKQAISDGRLANYKAPAAGKKLSHIQPETIAGVIALAEEHQAPAAADLLLRQVKLDTNGAMVSPIMIVPKSDGPFVHWLVATAGQAFVVVSTPAGSALYPVGANQQLAAVRRPEIVAHAARAEAGAVKLS